MKVKDAHELMKNIIVVLTSIWGIFILPSLILVGFALEGVLILPTENMLVLQILFYNILVLPLVLLASIILSWMFLKQKKYWPAIAMALLPLVSFFIEIIVADIAILLS